MDVGTGSINASGTRGGATRTWHIFPFPPKNNPLFARLTKSQERTKVKMSCLRCLSIGNLQFNKDICHEKRSNLYPIIAN